MFTRSLLAHPYCTSCDVKVILKRLTLRRIVILITALAIALQVFSMPARQQDISPSTLDGAFSHLAAEMDRYHAAVDVYTDVGSAGNHFLHYAKIADDFNAVDLDLCSNEKVHSGLTAIKSTFRSTTGQNWGGWYALNGILIGQDTSPRANFGETPSAGVDLQGATQVSFWAMGRRGGEKIEFFMGGVGRNPENGNSVMPFPDSTPRVPELGTTLTLSTTWTRYTIDLTGKNLSYILGGFAWVCTAQNNPNGAVFWIDDIQYNKPRLNEPRFIRSYVTLSGSDFDTNHRDVAFSYDNAVVMLTFMARGQDDDWRRAKLIADAFVYVQANDPTYNDSRVRNAYEAGDVMLPPGWAPNGKERAARLPVIVNCAKGTSGFERIQISSFTGNMAWVGISLLTYFQRQGGVQYLEAAQRIGEWIEGRRQTTGLGGYRGGFEGFDRPSVEHPNDPVEVSSVSTENNIDAFALFNKLFQITGEAIWKSRAAHAQSFIDKMLDQNIGCLLIGAKDSQTINRDFLSLDVQALSVLAMPDALTRFPNTLHCAENRHRTIKDGFTGYDFNDDKDGIWFEGSSYISLALRRTGDSSKAGEILSELRRTQVSAQNSNGTGLVAASHDGVTTGFRGPNMEVLGLFARLHLAATAWYALAEANKNPYAVFGFSNPQITGLTVKGKKLIVTGEGFDEGAAILVNGKAQKTSNDPSAPASKLIGKKAGKKLKPRDKVKIRNADGSESNEVEYEPSPG